MGRGDDGGGTGKEEGREWLAARLADGGGVMLTPARLAFSRLRRAANLLAQVTRRRFMRLAAHMPWWGGRLP